MQIFSRLFSSKKLISILQKMPKEPKHIPQLQKQRYKIKERIAKYPPGTVNMMFLTPGTGPASVYLFTDQSRYLFNCTEGTQRLAHEHRTKLARLEHVFMTRSSWSHIGGLPGLCLTVQDSGVPEITLHGPPGLDEIFKATRRFVVLRDLTVKSEECKLGNGYDDCVMSVQYVPLMKRNTNNESDSSEEESIAVDNEDYYAYENRSRPTLQTQNFMETLKRRNETTVTAFICKLKARPGTLDLEKCVEKGVPPGPMLGQLKNGFDVKLPNGTTVMARDVRGPDDPGPKFILIDVPSEDYLDSLVANEDHFFDTDETVLVVHFTPDTVVNTVTYQKFMNRFGDKTTHIGATASTRGNGLSGYLAAHRIQWQLNQLEPNIFPLLMEAEEFDQFEDNCENVKKKARVTETDETLQVKENGHHRTENVALEHINTLSSFHLRPLKGLDRTQEPILTPTEYLKELEVIPELNVLLEKLKRDLSTSRDSNEMALLHKNSVPRIVFLGTGSCIPNKTRNVSSIIIHTGTDSCILLDCGEGTVGQIYRFYGKERGDKVLKDLKAIYISHLHADHHLGLIGILQDRRRQLKDPSPVLLFAPRQITFWLSFYEKRIEPIERDYKLVSNGELIDQSYSSEDLLKSGISSIRTCLVKHCPHSFGVAIDIVSPGNQTPIKITYSGDTMPCQDLVELGKDSTLLIHEATMEDDLEDEARYKMHSTISQAIRQGELMNAKYTVLTHFSQRYSKLPRFDFETLNENVGIAFDNMEVTMADLPVLHKFYATLKLMFMEHVDEMDQKALKRALKKKRESQVSS